MDIEIHPLRKAEIPALRDFLISGFNELADAEFASEPVLEWKYFDPIGDNAGPRAFIATLNGRIVASVGICPTHFVMGESGQMVSAMHGVDWLASKKEVSAGLMVCQRSEEYSSVHFVIGGTSQAIAIKKKLGYKFPIEVPSFCRILRPMHWLRRPGPDAIWKSILKAFRDYGRGVSHLRRPRGIRLGLRQVSVFGDEVGQVTSACRMTDVHTLRTPELLNHFLRYPGKNISGWLLMEGSRVRGFALLSIVNKGGLRVGRIADCFMDSLDPKLWHSALCFLTDRLGADHADLVVCYGTTTWMATALKRSGFYVQKLSTLSLRDPKNRIPSDASFYLTHLEADHAYL